MKKAPTRRVHPWRWLVLLVGCASGDHVDDGVTSFALDVAPDTVTLEQDNEVVIATLGDLLEWDGDLVIVDLQEANL